VKPTQGYHPVMKRSAKVTLGAVTLLPLGWTIWLLIQFGGFMLQALGHGSVSQDEFGQLQRLLWLHAIAALVMVLLLVVYFVLCLRNRRLVEGARIGWMVALLVGGIFVMPIYFALHVWPESPPRAPA
jgi:hypothetical protein